MGESSVPGDGVAMTLGDLQRALVGPAFEQRQGLGLNRQILAVKPRHQPELTTRPSRLSADPALLLGLDAHVESLCVSREGPGRVSPDIARKLIQEQHQSKTRGWCCGPVLQLSCQSSFHGISEAALNRAVKVRIPAEPLNRPGFFKPEAEN